MMVAATREITHSDKQVRRRLWFGLLGGAGAWTAHLLLSYAVAEFGCVSGLHQYQWLGISLVAWILLAISLLTASVAAAATAATRTIPAPADESSPEGHLGRMGCMSSGSFLVIILVESIPILYYLSRC